MSATPPLRPTEKRLRRFLIAAGAFLVVASVALEWLRVGSPGFGFMQRLLVIVGAGLVAVGWLGRRVIGVYRGAAIGLLNIVVLLGAVEIGAWAIGKLLDRPRTLAPLADYHATQPWGPQYLVDLASGGGRYFHPTMIWRSAPGATPSINIDSAGDRRTPGATCGENAFTVFVFGGSTAWGYGVPDWGTIPTHLQAMLEPRGHGPVCVVNKAEPGFNSAQEVARLVDVLRQGRTPDLAIFYNGINDVQSADAFGQAGLFYDFVTVRNRVEQRVSPYAAILAETQLGSLIGRLKPPSLRLANPDPDSLARDVLRFYVGNMRTVRALAREYGFEYAVFWQPVLFAGAKPLTPEERGFLDREPASIGDFFRRVYARVEQAADTIPHFYHVADALDTVTSWAYIDIHHLVPEANRIVARRLLEVLEAEGLLHGH